MAGGHTVIVSNTYSSAVIILFCNICPDFFKNLHFSTLCLLRNLLCVYSKKHMNDGPELADMKRMSNTRTMKEMALLLRYLLILFAFSFKVPFDVWHMFKVTPTFLKDVTVALLNDSYLHLGVDPS